jgi:hypothetical protein
LYRSSRGRKGNFSIDDANGSAESHPRVRRGLNISFVARVGVGFSLVLAQLIYVLTVHLSNCCAERYFAWAPNDYSIDYQIAATVDGRSLNASEILERYRVSQSGFYEDPVERLEGVLQRRELVYGKTDHVSLIVEYRLNGRPSEWRWSNDK